MNTIPADPIAALVHLHIEGLRAEATADALARTAHPAHRGRRTWPASVAVALRETFARAIPARSAAAARRGEPCPTC